MTSATAKNPVEQLEEDRKFVSENEWMIRPCSLYHSEYKNCSSIKGRFYQYYRDGEMTDCNEWYVVDKDCTRFRRKDDYAAGARVIRSEMKRVEERRKNHEANDVWKPRTKRPPPNWSAPVAQHIEQRQQESYFIGREKEMKQPLEERSTCSIM